MIGPPHDEARAGLLIVWSRVSNTSIPDVSNLRFCLEVQMRRLLAAIILLLIVALLSGSALFAQQQPFAFRVELGRASNHGGSDEGLAASVGLHRDLDKNGILRIGMAVIAGPPYVGFDAGLEFLMIPQARLSPFASAGLGLMREPEWGGIIARITGGLRLRLDHRNSIRASVQRAAHEDYSGPNLISLGFERSFGSRHTRL